MMINNPSVIHWKRFYLAPTVALVGTAGIEDWGMRCKKSQKSIFS